MHRCPHHSDILPLSVYEVVAFVFPSLLLPETGLTGVTLWCADCWRQMDGFLSFYLVCWLQRCTFTEEDYPWLPWQLFLFDPIHASFKRDVQTPLWKFWHQLELMLSFHTARQPAFPITIRSAANCKAEKSQQHLKVDSSSIGLFQQAAELGGSGSCRLCCESRRICSFV